MLTRRFSTKQNRLKQLRAFCYTAQTGSVTRAAEQMFLSQPSISLLIKALEKDLGDQLFRRKGPHLTLTGHGTILMELALPYVEGMEKLTELYHERCNHTVSGRLSIATSESANLFILPPYIKQFRKKYPATELVIQNVTEKSGLEMLRNDSADILIASLFEIPTDAIYVPTHKYDAILITPLEHPLAIQKNISINDIGKHDLILPPQNQSARQVIDYVFLRYGINYSIALEVTGPEAIKKYVEMGLGISVVTRNCISGVEKIRAIKLDNYFPEINYGLVIRRGKFLTPASRCFIDLVDAGACSQIGKIQGPR
jgi:DNA-binding transcriptional LysR family regulator